MKIFYISGAVIPSRKANSIQVMRMCEAFSQIGHDVTLFSGSGNATDGETDFAGYGVESNFTIIKRLRPGIPIAKSLIYAVDVWRAVSSSRYPDLFYAREPYALAGLCHLGIPFLYEAHSPPVGPRKWIENRIFRSHCFRRLIVISESLRREYVRLYPWLPAKAITVAHDAAQPYRRAGSNDTPVISGQRDGCIQVGYVGHLYRGRGIEVIIQLAKRFPDSDFHVVGGDRKDILRWIASTGSIQNIYFHGFAPPSQCDKYLTSFDVVLAPYQRNVFVSGGKTETSRWMSPLKIFEYMSAGKAIIASDLPVLREVLEHDHNCLLVEPDNIEAWSAAIERLKNAELRMRLGAAAQKQFEREHTWDKRAETVLRPLVQAKGAQECVV
ncbi:putative glycosyl transferase [Rosistilla carotiformis]|uniref:Putative glycosyl transferase n=1 Tax=Rosistilla carotiformis TaxID=2528017 RepID=A0A518K0V0_9BACT|nr:glycosyltransferase family 4 protein [Rosistilla carotiformis]QDV71422.1 putative glycosyl transferase [Rosistilla carotiformis]